MSETHPDLACGACGLALSELPSLPSDERRPCPSCGSLARRFNVAIAATLNLRMSFGLKGKRAGYQRPFFESTSGDELHRKSGKWMQKERLIDREKDQYKEIVTDPETGAIVHRCEEPLSQHRGHGSAHASRKSRQHNS